MIRKNDHKLSDLLQVFVQDRRMKPRLYEKKIQQGWREMMGPWIEKETESIKLRNHKVLINISSAPLKQELHYARQQILDKINELLGEDYVQEVQVH